MKFIDLAFRLGVIFAIFGFIWGIFQLILGIARGIRPKTIYEEYSFKFVQYFFLVDVTFLFCINADTTSDIRFDELFLSGIILLLYFLGKFQKKQQRLSIFQISGSNFPKFQPIFNKSLEITAILFAVGIFVFFIFYPSFANNPLSNWFYESIFDIEETPIFGLIFRVIGFFVLLGIFLKLVNGFSFLLSGRPIATVESEIHSKSSDKDNFDDFEEIN